MRQMIVTYDPMAGTYYIDCFRDGVRFYSDVTYRLAEAQALAIEATKTEDFDEAILQSISAGSKKYYFRDGALVEVK